MKIICIGRNYAAHAAELNNSLPDKPIIFLKPDTALLKNNSSFYYPEFSKDIHFECELVFRICKEGKNISEKFAINYVDKVTVGIDYTARDLQDDCKAKGLPWERAKSFDGSAVVGDMIDINEIKDINNIAFTFYKNEGN
jgi:2-keto-4-pentenoate hydratase/2-oxohepta-3-ene-1,7-dioic acid hydratase in catechol pathway